MGKHFLSGAAARHLHNRDKKNIFKHYGKMSREELDTAEKRLKAHIAHYSKQGIHTTPEHMQSIKYHKKNPKVSALSRAKC